MDRMAATTLTDSPPAPLRSRAALLVACVVAAAAAQCIATVTTTSATSLVEPELATLLRGMAAIKALLVLVAIGAAWWRLGHPTTRRVAVGYGIGLATMCAATVLIAHLAWLVAAAVGFHVGALLMMVVAWRDGGLAPIVAFRRAAVPAASAGSRAAPRRTTTPTASPRTTTPLQGAASHAG